MNGDIIWNFHVSIKYQIKQWDMYCENCDSIALHVHDNSLQNITSRAHIYTAICITPL